MRLSKEYAELSPMVAKVREYRAALSDLAGTEELARSGDKEMAELAYEEMGELKEKVEALSQEIRILLLPKDAADEKSAILEVRAGTGGDEAALFAGDLFRMYQRYAESQGWKVSVMEASEALATSATNRNVCNPKRPPHRTGLCSLRTRRPCLSRRMFPSPHAPVPVAWTSRCA